MHKTLAMKLLEAKSIPYRALAYPVEERDAIVVAAHLGVPPEHVYKTLVVNRSNRKPLLVLVPADRRLGLKKLAKVTGDKKLNMASHAEAETLTGLQVGGISPLALINRGFVVYLDVTARNRDKIFVSAGQKGINLEIRVEDLVKLTRARFGDVSEVE